jgi:hypothetical protein
MVLIKLNVCEPDIEKERDKKISENVSNSIKKVKGNNKTLSRKKHRQIINYYFIVQKTIYNRFNTLTAFIKKTWDKKILEKDYHNIFKRCVEMNTLSLLTILKCLIDLKIIKDNKFYTTSSNSTPSTFNRVVKPIIATKQSIFNKYFKKGEKVKKENNIIVNILDIIKLIYNPLVKSVIKDLYLKKILFINKINGIYILYKKELDFNNFFVWFIFYHPLLTPILHPFKIMFFIFILNEIDTYKKFLSITLQDYNTWLKTKKMDYNLFKITDNKIWEILKTNGGIWFIKNKFSIDFDKESLLEGNISTLLINTKRVKTDGRPDSIIVKENLRMEKPLNKKVVKKKRKRREKGETPASNEFEPPKKRMKNKKKEDKKIKKEDVLNIFKNFVLKFGKGTEVTATQVQSQFTKHILQKHCHPNSKLYFCYKQIQRDKETDCVNNDDKKKNKTGGMRWNKRLRSKLNNMEKVKKKRQRFLLRIKDKPITFKILGDQYKK